MPERTAARRGLAMGAGSRSDLTCGVPLHARSRCWWSCPSTTSRVALSWGGFSPGGTASWRQTSGSSSGLVEHAPRGRRSRRSIATVLGHAARHRARAPHPLAGCSRPRPWRRRSCPTSSLAIGLLAFYSRRHDLGSALGAARRTSCSARRSSPPSCGRGSGTWTPSSRRRRATSVPARSRPSCGSPSRARCPPSSRARCWRSRCRSTSSSSRSSRRAGHADPAHRHLLDGALRGDPRDQRAGDGAARW